MTEDEIRRMTQMHAIADYLQKVLPIPPTTPAIAKAPPPTTRRLAFGTQTSPEKKKQTVPPPQPSTSTAETFASTPKSSFAEISDDDDDDDDDVFVEEEAQAFGRENVGPIASPYIVPYLYNRRYLDTQYGLRKDGDSFKIGDSAVLVDPNSNITIKGREFKGTTGLWELLTRKNVDRKNVTTYDLKKYKKILALTNAHLISYQPGGDIQITRGAKYREFIAPLFSHTRRRGVETALRRRWVQY